MIEENEPLVVNFKLDNVNITEKIYYRDSDLLNKLQYYPLGLLLILLLFGSIIYLAFKSNKIAEFTPIVESEPAKVLTIYPIQDSVPENLLKFHHFSPKKRKKFRLRRAF